MQVVGLKKEEERNLKDHKREEIYRISGDIKHDTVEILLGYGCVFGNV